MTLDPELLKAYQKTHYHVHATPTFFLQPEVYSKKLEQLHKKIWV